MEKDTIVEQGQQLARSAVRVMIDNKITSTDAWRKIAIYCVDVLMYLTTIELLMLMNTEAFKIIKEQGLDFDLEMVKKITSSEELSLVLSIQTAGNTVMEDELQLQEILKENAHLIDDQLNASLESLVEKNNSYSELQALIQSYFEHMLSIVERGVSEMVLSGNNFTVDINEKPVMLH